MPVFDKDLMFRTTASLTASETSAALTINGVPISGMAARVVVPAAFSDDDTLQIKVKYSAAGSTYTILGNSMVLTGFKTNPRDVIVPLVGNYKYVKLELVVTSTTAANIDFGTVEAGVVGGVNRDWSRT
jgi:hypothetical protein